MFYVCKIIVHNTKQQTHTQYKVTQTQTHNIKIFNCTIIISFTLYKFLKCNVVIELI